ncbi:alkaline shock response membrane anchor protein AmaP [Microbispora sp. RL4-1S]|uniref:Alkaline shock response membrane anchor protein AmaP n=1 Tax=Microbispora oryzae TaxID=2806554 RepID=A0A941AIK6_9ACTN|nr:DUF6286 domain-containing protein [Microbispora oryzae]MBP2705266.1 alkaline shock response membrane anchor protein AmaP [Microbispora oryzae]
MSVVQEILAGSSAPGVPSHRAPRRAASRVLLPGRTPAAVAVAAALTVVGWAVTAEIVAAMLGGSLLPSPLRRLLAVTFGHPALPGAAAAMIITGAGLVALAVLPGRPRLVPLETDDPLLVMGLTHGGLRRTVAAAAREVDGVQRVHVRILRGRIEVTVVTDAQRVGDLLREVGAAVGDRLSGLRAQCRHEVVVRLRAGRG